MGGGFHRPSVIRGVPCAWWWTCPFTSSCGEAMKHLRTFLFWSHLVVALAAGLIIAIMALTGAAVAFEPQLLAWVERPSATVAPPHPAVPLPLDRLLAGVAAARPDLKPSAITLS